MGEKEHRLAFCTLGMMIIDEIDYGKGRDKQDNVLGGAGTYAALGARLAAGRSNAHLVSWIVDRGSDFPDELMSVIGTWNTSCVFRTNVDRRTTRALNSYGPNEDRAFEYLTPKQRLEASDLNDDQVLAESFHMVCSPNRCMELCRDIYLRRWELDHSVPESFNVWEPVPDLCGPDELQNLKLAVCSVKVISPNGGEFSSFFENQDPKPDRKAMVEQVLGRKLGKGDIFPLFVIREGAEGSYLFLGEHQVHFPAYHRNGAGVVDPTGGGNTFLGALSLAMTGKSSPTSNYFIDLGWNVRVPNLVTLIDTVCAVIHATIAASFAIEQVGMPQVDKGQPDTWNAQSYAGRYSEYVEREGPYLLRQLNQGKPADDR